MRAVTGPTSIGIDVQILLSTVRLRRLAGCGVVGVLAALPSAWVMFEIHGTLEAFIVAGVLFMIVTGLALCLLLLVTLAIPHHERLLASISANVGSVPALLDELPVGPPPLLGGWALDGPAVVELLRTVRESRPRNVLELGPGASTDLLLRQVEGPLRLVSVEHDAGWVATLVAAHPASVAEGRLEVRHAPLTRLRVPGWRGRWYDRRVFEDLTGIDLLIVDGPPSATSGRARYPALPVLRELLAPGATIFVDDTGRSPEKQMLAQWLQSGSVELVRRSSNHCVLRYVEGRDNPSTIQEVEET
jgi:hypothetical protein